MNRQLQLPQRARAIAKLEEGEEKGDLNDILSKVSASDKAILDGEDIKFFKDTQYMELPIVDIPLKVGGCCTVGSKRGRKDRMK
ncbi:hypothetical protein QE152_g32608 [Popillia japonica]|uniref:Uncharacterized protein n=1 Tax=Popillia japonica TaxID=7064 RepID=A0AAW1IYU2_POPJA